MNLTGQPAHVGRHCGSNRYEVGKEVVAFYEDALDDHSDLYAQWAPPLLYHSECYKFVGEWYLKNLFGNLHMQQDWRLFAPIPVGGSVVTRSTIIDRYQKRGRDIVLNETDVIDANDGRLLVRGHTHQSFLPPKEESSGDGSFVVDEKTADKKKQAAKRPPFPTATGADLPVQTTTIDPRRCWMFSGPGKNYHTDAEQAKKLGFPNIVVQGMMSTCFVSRMMQEQFGMGWLAGGEMSVKLVNVLWVDETVTTRGKIREEVREGTQTRIHCDVWAEKEGEAGGGEPTKVIVGSASALV
jgi:acyl dehydratase